MDTKNLVSSFLWAENLPTTYRQSIEQFFMPAANGIIADFQQSDRCYIVGINGCQGSGKTTLSKFLEIYFKALGLNALAISLDDFYYSKEDRQLLAEETHPLLRTRGVPGTHDINALKNTLIKVKSGQADFFIPKFSKAMDDRLPEAAWYQVFQPVNILIVEGWCWGATAQSPESLMMPVNKLEALEDKEGIWKHYVNESLRNDYEPLYQYVDRWLMLQAPGFECVYRWRQEQEEKLKKKLAQVNLVQGPADSGLMSPEEIARFVQYYQRITEHVLQTLPKKVDVLWRLDQHRRIASVTCADESLLRPEGVE